MSLLLLEKPVQPLLLLMQMPQKARQALSLLLSRTELIHHAKTGSQAFSAEQQRVLLEKKTSTSIAKTAASDTGSQDRL